MEQKDGKMRAEKKFKVKVRGGVGEQLADYYSGINSRIKGENDDQVETELIGWFPDQTALIGMLTLLHDWGHALLYVEYIPQE